jgi:hypothetical protein
LTSISNLATRVRPGQARLRLKYQWLRPEIGQARASVRPGQAQSMLITMTPDQIYARQTDRLPTGLGQRRTSCHGNMEHRVRPGQAVIGQAETNRTKNTADDRDTGNGRSRREGGLI